MTHRIILFCSFYIISSICIAQPIDNIKNTDKKKNKRIGCNINVNSSAILPINQLNEIGGSYGVSIQPAFSFCKKGKPYGIIAKIDVSLITLNQTKSHNYFRKRNNELNQYRNNDIHNSTDNEFMTIGFYSGIYYEFDVNNRIQCSINLLAGVSTDLYYLLGAAGGFEVDFQSNNNKDAISYYIFPFLKGVTYNPNLGISYKFNKRMSSGLNIGFIYNNSSIEVYESKYINKVDSNNKYYENFTYTYFQVGAMIQFKLYR